MRRILPYLVALAILGPAVSYGLGLGELVKKSGLNEPFRGRIDVVGVDAEVASNLTVRLAPNARFEQAGLARPVELNKLRFDIVEDEDGPSHIAVTSREPIVEPFLNFLLELSWPQGRLLREYTVLLDPPIYDPTPRYAAAPAQQAGSATGEPGEARAASAPPAPTGPAAPPASGGTLGRETRAGDTLWSIASQVRPDESVSVQQTMLALLEANPEAFAEENVNTLKRGYVLQIPDYEAMNAVSQSEALARVREHHALWQQYRETAAAGADARPQGSADSLPESEAPAEPEPAGPAEEDARLELVSVEDEGGAGTAGAAPDQAELERMDLESLKRELALAKEALAASDSENAELRGELTETEELVGSLERLIEIRESELAALQDQLGGEAAQEAPGEAEAPPPEPAEPEPAEAEPAEAEPDEAERAEAEPAEPEALATAEAPPDEGGRAQEDAFEAADLGEAGVPESGGGLLATLRGYVDSVPGGMTTVLGVLAALILAPILAVAARRRRDAEEVPAVPGRERAPALGPEDATVAAGAGAAAEAQSFDLGEHEEDEDTTISTAAVSEDATEVPTEPPAQPPAPAEAEEDPLAEINVYLAYERFDQAEELVREAIAGDPSNQGYRVRLLEVFYASGDKAAYENAARELYEMSGGEGEHWETALAMWSAMSPDRELFAEGAGEAGVEEDAAKEFVDLTAGDEDVAGDTVTIRPEARAELEGLADGEEQGEGALDLDLTSEGDSGEDFLDLTATSDEDALAGGEEGEDFLDLTAGEAQGEADSDTVFDMTTEKLEGTAGGLDFDIAAHAGAAEDETLDITAGASEGGEDDVLDITAGEAQEEADSELLDLTATGSGAEFGEGPLDVTATGDIGSLDHEDLLNVTAPGALETGRDQQTVGLEDETVLDVTAGDEEESLEFDLSGGGEEQDALELDVTGGEAGSGGEEAAFDLDLTGGEEAESGEADRGPSGGEEELLALDVTGGGEEASFDLDITGGETEAESGESSAGDVTAASAGEEESLDFDIGDLDARGAEAGLEGSRGPEIDLSESVPGAAESAGGEDVLDRTGGEAVAEQGDRGVDEETLRLDAGGGDELDLTIGEEESISLEDTGAGEASFDQMFDQEAAEGAGAPPAAGEPPLDLSFEEPEGEAGAEEAPAGLSFEGEEFDFTLDEEAETTERVPGPAAYTGEGRLGDTVTGLTLGEEDGDGEDDDGRVLVGDSQYLETVRTRGFEDAERDAEAGDQTVTMPREESVEEQSEEDEADTKLNLAKAYMELGDNDGARAILEEVHADGSEAQRREAGELLEQLG